MSSLRYDIPIYEGYPFGLNDLQSLNGDSKFAMMAFLRMVPGFDSASPAILSGLILTGTSLSEGWVYIPDPAGGVTYGHVVYVPPFTAQGGQTTADLGLTLEKVNVEQILWEDGQTRDTLFNYRGKMQTYTSDPSEFQLSTVKRLGGKVEVAMAADWQGATVSAFRHGDRVELIGRAQYTASPTINAKTLIGTIPIGFRPVVKQAISVPIGSATPSVTGMLEIETNGEVYITGEFNQSQYVFLDRRAFTL